MRDFLGGGRAMARATGSTVSIESFNHDNLELARARRRRRGLPLLHFAAFCYLVLVLRIVTIAGVGPGMYNARMAEMQRGNVVERAAAFLMQPDAVSRDLARNMRWGLEFFMGR